MTERIMEIVVTCDVRYLDPLRTMLFSLRSNNATERIRVWLLHQDIPRVDLDELSSYCAKLDIAFESRTIEQGLFADAPVSERYPQEMYYRLLAPHVIDEPVDRVLYLDPDILVINPLAPLYDIDLHGCAFAAASHLDAIHPASPLNNVRLKTDSAYFNTGVILMDIQEAKMIVDPETLFAYARKNEHALLFPDQDLFNALFSEHTLFVPDELWNYDARMYTDNIIRTGGAAKLDWIMDNTGVIHFCGRDKPWKAKYQGKFASLYKHYSSRAHRL